MQNVIVAEGIEAAFCVGCWSCFVLGKTQSVTLCVCVCVCVLTLHFLCKTRGARAVVCVCGVSCLAAAPYSMMPSPRPSSVLPCDSHTILPPFPPTTPLPRTATMAWLLSPSWVAPRWPRTGGGCRPRRHVITGDGTGKSKHRVGAGSYRAGCATFGAQPTASWILSATSPMSLTWRALGSGRSTSHPPRPRTARGARRRRPRTEGRSRSTVRQRHLLLPEEVLGRRGLLQDGAGLRLPPL